MRLTTIVIALSVALISLECEATWEDAKTRGIFPYWQHGGEWYTLLVFVNGSEETSDVLHLRFRDVHGSGLGSGPSDTHTVYCIAPGEMLTFSTTPEVPTWIAVTAGSGYISFRAEYGGFIHPYCVVYNRVTQTGYTVPAYNQDHGF